MKQDLSHHGMFPIGEKVQLKHTLTSPWFIHGGFGICNLVICHSHDQIPGPHSDAGLVDVWYYELANLQLDCRLRWRSRERMGKLHGLSESLHFGGSWMTKSNVICIFH